jgi:hypothetical protein
MSVPARAPATALANSRAGNTPERPQKARASGVWIGARAVARATGRGVELGGSAGLGGGTFAVADQRGSPADAALALVGGERLCPPAPIAATLSRQRLFPFW